MGVVLFDPIAVPVTPRDFDLIIPDDHATPQDGDDAQGDRPYVMLIRRDAYAGDLDLDGDYILVICEPATVFSGDIALSGDYVALMMMPGGDFGELLLISGDQDSLLAVNGIDFDGILLSGANGFIDGGGWSAISNGGIDTPGIELAGDDGIIRVISAATTGGGGTAVNALRLTGDRHAAVLVRIADSDNHGIDITTGSDDILILGVIVLAADNRGMQVKGFRARLIGMRIIDAIVGDGIDLLDDGDNSVLCGSVINVPGVQNPVDIAVDCEDCVVAGNRTDGAVNDASGTSTVGDNVTAAF